jgi:hypothetical protein
MALVAGAPTSGAAHPVIGQSGPAPAAEVPQRASGWPAVAAKFTVSTTGEGSSAAIRSDWYLRREADRIERIRPDAGTAEIWERDDRGDVSLKRVFRDEARIVEYAPGNLRAMQLQARWEVLGGAVDPRLIHTLQQAGLVETPHGSATVFEGDIAGAHIELWWLDALQLPARVVEQRQTTRIVVELQAQHSQPPADWPRADLPKQLSAEVIDVADLGDRHYDSFVKQIEQADSALRGRGGWWR